MIMRIASRTKDWRFRLSLALLCCLSTAQLPGQVELSLLSTAKRLADEFQEENVTSIVLKVEGPDGFPSAGQNLFQELLGSEFEKLGIAITNQDAPGIAANLKVADVKEEGTNNTIAIALIGKLNRIDRLGVIHETKDSYRLPITNRSNVCRILGIPIDTTTVSPSDDLQLTTDQQPNFSRDMLQSYRKPQQAIKDTLVRAKEGGLFGIEIIVNGKAQQPKVVDGYAVIAEPEMDTFQIRLVNDAPYEVGMELALDGIDSYWYSNQLTGYWVVGPNSKRVVRGWQLDDQQEQDFTAVLPSRMKAAKTNVPRRLSLITASVYRAYQPDEPYLDDSAPFSLVRTIEAGLVAQFYRRAFDHVGRKFGRIRACVPVRFEPKRTNNIP